MYGKARLFGDAEVAARSSRRVIRASTRRSAARWRVRRHVWKRERESIVRAGSHGKFTQNPALLGLLLETRGTELVEASPYDGSRASASPRRIRAPKTRKWRGQNLSARSDRVRDELFAA